MSSQSKSQSSIPESPLHTEELQRLNRNYDAASRLTSAARNSFASRLIAKIRNFFFSDYVQAQSEFQADLVRVLNRLSSLEDKRLWRMDDEQLGAIESLERRLLGQLQSEKDMLLASVSMLESRVDRQTDELNTLDSVTRGLERIIGRLSATDSGSSSSAMEEASERIVEGETRGLPHDYRYVLLENRYRGSEEEISKRLEVYVEFFKSASKPILEIGSGRGEFLELLRSATIPAYGIEIDSAMLELCLEKSLDVREADGIEHLRSLDDASLGGLIAVQVVEHLDLAKLEELLKLAAKKVVPGGSVIFETINTNSMLALCQNYFRDPTHAQPLHPQTMQFMAEMSGLEVCEIRELSAYPQEACLQEIPTQDFMTPEAKGRVELLNHNFSALNALLFGHQDYSIIATPESANRADG